MSISPLYIAIAAILLAIFLAFAAILIRDNRRFVVRKYSIHSPQIKSRFRFVFLTDLHNTVYGEENEPVLAAIEASAPDAVLIGGDLIVYKKAVRGKEYCENALSLTRRIAERWPVYYANGNHEQHLMEDNETLALYEAFIQQLRDAGVTILNNRGTVLPGNRELYLQGLALPMDYYERFRLKKLPLGVINTLIGEKSAKINRQTEETGPIDGPGSSEEPYVLLLAHTPDQMETYAEWGADLCLCGHLHGGIARLPLIGGVIGPQTGLFPRRSAGRMTVQRPDGETCEIIISCGMGMHKLPVRFCNPGELTVVDLEPA